MAALSGPQLAALWIKAGGPKKYARTAAAIALAESDGEITADNSGLNKDGSADYGPWQINSIHGFNRKKLKSDPLYNARAAVKVFNGQGFAAWVQYKNGGWRKRLPDVGRIAEPGEVPSGGAQGSQEAVSRPSGFAGGPSVGLGDLLARSLSRPQTPVSTPAVPGGLDARQALALPAGYQAPQASAAPQEQGPTLEEQLVAASQLRGPEPDPIARNDAEVRGGGAQPSRRGAPTRGGVEFNPGADAPGNRTNGGVRYLASLVAGEFGEPVRVGTGTNHSRFTVNGKVSEHSTGDAVDIPASGERLTSLGAAALRAVGYTPSQAKRMARAGGIFNVNFRGRRAQIIVNTEKGGNHYDHLHVGYR